MPNIRDFCAAMSNFQDELFPVFGLSAQAFMSQIFDFETDTGSTPYNSLQNGDGPATIAQKQQQIIDKFNRVVPIAKKGGNTQISVLAFLELTLSRWILGATTQGRLLGGLLVPARFIDQLTAIIEDLKARKITTQKAMAEFALIK